jgi:hypothetical protein
LGKKSAAPGSVSWQVHLLDGQEAGRHGKDRNGNGMGTGFGSGKISANLRFCLDPNPGPFLFSLELLSVACTAASRTLRKPSAKKEFSHGFSNGQIAQ